MNNHLRNLCRQIIFVFRRKIVFPIQRLLYKEECFTFTCNICGKITTSRLIDIKGRETPSCFYCGSTLRFRAIIDALSISAFGKSLALPDFPVSKDLVCIGMSDSDNYAVPLSTKFNYTNTFYHREPKLDIADINSSIKYSVDLVISTDVFEHVPPPVEVAFNNLYNLLNNNGACIFSVPYKLHGATDEHFKDLFDYKILNKGKYVLENISKDGTKQIFTDLCFHGGPGSTLEMRVFSLSSLLDHLKNAGFVEIQIHGNNPDFGIIWDQKDSLILSMRKTGQNNHTDLHYK